MKLGQKVMICKEGETKPLLTGFFFLSINPQMQARMISHPVEDGSKTFDNKIVEPDRVSIVGEVYTSDNGDPDEIISEMLSNREFSFYDVYTKTMVYPRMSLVSASHRERQENPDTLEYSLNFQEVLLAGKRPLSQVDPADAPTRYT